MKFFQNSKFKIQNSTSGGFTLVETLVATAILVVAVLAPLAIAQSGLQGARYTQDQVTATFLGQEAIELVKYQVYANMNAGSPTPWLSGVVDGTTNCETAMYGCEVLVPTASAGTVIQACTGVCRVYLDNSTNMYSANSSGVLTKFTRQIRLASVVANQEEKVTVTLTWPLAQGGTHTYSASDYIFKWR